MAVLVERPVERVRGRGDDEAAASVAEVGELEDVGVRLEEDVLAHDPGVRGPVRDVGRDVGRPREDVAHRARLDHEPPAAVA